MSGRGPGCASPTQINKEVLQLLNRFYKKTEDVCVCVRVRDKQFRLFLQTHFCVNVLVTLQEDHIQIRLHTHTTYTHARALTHNIHMHTRTHTRTHVHMHRCWSIPPRGVFASPAADLWMPLRETPHSQQSMQRTVPTKRTGQTFRWVLNLIVPLQPIQHFGHDL